jgi:hypothetical protein
LTNKNKNSNYKQISGRAPTRYSDADWQSSKEIILNKITKAQLDLDLIKSAYMNDLNNGTDDTSPTFKAFEGSESMSKTEYN